MTDWITDRLPTEADTDKHKDVLVPGKPGDPVDADTNDYWDYRYITLGQPWFPANTKPASAPADRAPDQAEPTLQELYSQAELEHLRAKTALLKAQTAAFERSQQRKGVIEFTSMSDNELDHFIADVAQEIDRRQALKGDHQ